MVKLLDILLEQYIDPSEALEDLSSLKTVIDGKRNVCFLVKDAVTTSEWNKIQKLITDNGLKSMYVRGNEGDAYVVYRPGSENQATKLKDVAEKYGGYLHYKASDKDTREIGKLLQYDPEAVEEYIKNRKV